MSAIQGNPRPDRLRLYGPVGGATAGGDAPPRPAPREQTKLLYGLVPGVYRQSSWTRADWEAIPPGERDPRATYDAYLDAWQLIEVAFPIAAPAIEAAFPAAERAT